MVRLDSGIWIYEVGDVTTLPEIDWNTNACVIDEHIMSLTRKVTCLEKSKRCQDDMRFADLERRMKRVERQIEVKVSLDKLNMESSGG